MSVQTPTPNPEASLSKPKPRLSELTILTSNSLFSFNPSLKFHNYKNEPALFHLKVSARFSRSCRLTLHSGSSKSSPVLATCEFDKFLPSISISQPSYQDSRLARIPPDRYTWAIASDQASQDAGLEFIWLLQKDGGVGFANPNWKLVDARTSEVHAVMNWRFDGGTERGGVQFRRSLGEDWEMGVLIGVGVLLERERFRRSQRGNFTAGDVYY